jgi:hypothetical protein
MLIYLSLNTRILSNPRCLPDIGLVNCFDWRWGEEIQLKLSGSHGRRYLTFSFEIHIQYCQKVMWNIDIFYVILVC